MMGYKPVGKRSLYYGDIFIGYADDLPEFMKMYPKRHGRHTGRRLKSRARRRDQIRIFLEAVRTGKLRQGYVFWGHTLADISIPFTLEKHELPTSYRNEW